MKATSSKSRMEKWSVACKGYLMLSIDVISRSSPIDWLSDMFWLHRHVKKKVPAVAARPPVFRAPGPRLSWWTGKSLESHWKVWKPLGNSKLFWIHSFGDGSKPCTPVVHIKIAGKWMFIPLKMVSIGIDPYPFKFKMILSGTPTKLLESSLDWVWKMILWTR